jgi:hypothetical protein
MSIPPVEKRFAVLAQIARAQHFAWRQAVLDCCPDADVVAVTARMWELTGRETAHAYLRRIDPTQPLAPQVAEAIVWSSQCMGEDAVCEPGATSSEALVRHRSCPWLDWHRRLGLVAEDRPGCDTWFRATVDEVNRVLGASLRVETREALPDGGPSCLRRLWNGEG